jgi:hypothetical protein
LTGLRFYAIIWSHSKGENMKMYWFNYKKNEMELVETPETFEDYIPQDQASQGIYFCRMQLGDSHMDAALSVLKLHVKEL